MSCQFDIIKGDIDSIDGEEGSDDAHDLHEFLFLNSF